MKVPMDCVRGFTRQALSRYLQSRIMARKTKLDVGGRKTVERQWKCTKYNQSGDPEWTKSGVRL